MGLRRSGTESSARSESLGTTALEKGRERGGLSLTLVLFPYARVEVAVHRIRWEILLLLGGEKTTRKRQW